jgi:hypothetical protein
MATPREQFQNLANGAHWIDLIVRYNGEDVRIQGDWVKHIVRERNELAVVVKAQKETIYSMQHRCSLAEAKAALERIEEP